MHWQATAREEAGMDMLTCDMEGRCRLSVLANMLVVSGLWYGRCWPSAAIGRAV